jgi:hypothetical protein
MAFQLALGCVSGVHRKCCDECDPTECNISVVHEADGGITVTWSYSSPYRVVTSAELNGVSVLGDPNIDSGTVYFALADIPDDLVLELVNECGTSTCHYDVPCCWKWQTLRISFQNVSDISLSCSKTYTEPFPRPPTFILEYDYSLAITGLTALNGTWLLDIDAFDCEVATTDQFIGYVTYTAGLRYVQRVRFTSTTDTEYTYSTTIPGAIYLRGTAIVFVPTSQSHTTTRTIHDLTNGTTTTSSYTLCLGTPAGITPCVDIEWVVAVIEQPACDHVPTYYLETAYYIPFALGGSAGTIYLPQLGNSAPFDMPNSRCAELNVAIPLEVDVEYV